MLRPSSAAPVVCWTYAGERESGGDAHVTASKNQYVLIVRAAVAELMQWLAEKKYGVNELPRSLSSWPVHRYVLPFSCVKMIFATAFDALTSAVDCGTTHLTSISHEPELPMSRTSFAVSALRF